MPFGYYSSKPIIKIASSRHLDGTATGYSTGCSNRRRSVDVTDSEQPKFKLQLRVTGRSLFTGGLPVGSHCGRVLAHHDFLRDLTIKSNLRLRQNATQRRSQREPDLGAYVWLMWPAGCSRPGRSGRASRASLVRNPLPVVLVTVLSQAG